jgi:hypothetical protein
MFRKKDGFDLRSQEQIQESTMDKTPLVAGLLGVVVGAALGVAGYALVQNGDISRMDRTYQRAGAIQAVDALYEEEGFLETEEEYEAAIEAVRRSQFYMETLPMEERLEEYEKIVRGEKK